MVIALILSIGITPMIISLIVGVYSRKHFQQNLQLAADFAAQERLNRALQSRNPDEHYVDGIGLVIGDITCQLNARSPYVRCAANPFGPCTDCSEYEGRDYD